MEVVLEEAGKLDISPIALALSWNLSRPGVVAPIIGPKSVKQLISCGWRGGCCGR
jgi:aryl-alcohol dehydrogenase-like predicted oxidoreductase